MAITIEDPTTERLARDLAKLTGESVTVAVRKALEERQNRLSDESHKTNLLDDLVAIRRRCAALPVRDDRMLSDLVGYDDDGLPRG